MNQKAQQRNDAVELLQVDGEILPEVFYSEMAEVSEADVENEVTEIGRSLPNRYRKLPDAKLED